MDHILNLIERAKMNQPVQQPVPTEKSQIVIAYTISQPSLVVRFNTVKKGEKAFKELKKAWFAWYATYEPSKKLPPRFANIDADMFVSCIDLSCVASISFVDHVKREKFVPI